MRPLLALAVIPFLATPAHAAEIALTDPADVSLAVAISDAVDAVTEQVGACIGGGGAHQACLCASEADIAQLRNALDDALAVRPDWRDQTLFVADTGDGNFRSLTLFLDTIAVSAAPPDCG